MEVYRITKTTATAPPAPTSPARLHLEPGTAKAASSTASASASPLPQPPMTTQKTRGATVPQTVDSGLQDSEPWVVEQAETAPSQPHSPHRPASRARSPLGSSPAPANAIPATGVVAELVHAYTVPGQVGSVVVEATPTADGSSPAIFASQPSVSLRAE